MNDRSSVSHDHSSKSAERLPCASTCQPAWCALPASHGAAFAVRQRHLVASPFLTSPLRDGCRHLSLSGGQSQAAPLVPIVFAAVGDPVGTGIVASLARPGGNVTGLSALTADLAGKRLELLREVVPGLGRLAIMGNFGNPLTVLELGEL